MNYNIFAYTLYLFIILYVVISVGTKLYRNGAPFLIDTFSGDEVIAMAVNKFLLAGYYLLNIGYSIIVINGWRKVDSFQSLIEVVAYKAGTIILLLGIMHIFNIITLVVIAKKRKNNRTHHSINH